MSLSENLLLNAYRCILFFKTSLDKFLDVPPIRGGGTQYITLRGRVANMGSKISLKLVYE